MLLTIPEVAGRLRCGPATVYRLCHDDSTFPVIKLNSKCFRVNDEALERWIAKAAKKGCEQL